MKHTYALFLASCLCLTSIVFAQDTNLTLLGHYPFSVELSDVWGYVDEEGNEYALVGRHEGFSVIDVTDPTNMTEVFSAPGVGSTWRDIKTWGDYAYVTCECGPGLLIVDLSPLPDTAGLTYTYWNGDTLTFYQAHNLYIDERGIAHIFGAYYSMGGDIMLDLTQDPMDPVPIGMYDEAYLHDGVVRGDTLWGAAINDGEAQVIDVSDPANPVKMAAWKTPSVFTHNIWFSDDNKYVFTTDEVKNGSIGMYEVSNIYNPQMTANWKPKDTAIIPHNTHFLNDYLITSHYTIGINIIDVKRPGNPIQTAIYDTAPNYHGDGYDGCWGAYPYLPSGRILATDIQEGLYVFEPNYVRGCYLEGKVTDLHTGIPIFFPEIEILEDSSGTTGNLVGDYAMATLKPGTYTAVVSKDGYFPDTATVVLSNGQLTVHDVQLNNWPLGLEETNASNSLSLFPNPTSGEFSLNNTQSAEEMVLRDLQGRVVYSQSLQPGMQSISLPANVAPGFYVCSFNGPTELATLKLYVE